MEIKPDLDLEIRDLRRMIDFSPEKQLLLIAGIPSKETMNLVHPAIDWLDDKDDGYGKTLYLLEHDFRVNFRPNTSTGEWTLVYLNNPLTDEFAYKEAILTAKQSRFEFRS